MKPGLEPQGAETFGQSQSSNGVLAQDPGQIGEVPTLNFKIMRVL